MKRQSILISVVVLILLGDLAFGAFGECEIIDVGTFEMLNSDALINDNNQVVGYLNHGPAIIWEDGLITELPTLGGSHAAPFAINNSGQIVGYARDENGKSHAVFWEDGVITDLGGLGGDWSCAYGINNTGQISGSATDPNNERRAFLWEDGLMTNLGTLGGEFSSASAINNFGVVLGVADNASGERHIVLWEDGVILDLGPVELPFPGCSARSINDANEIVGYISNHSGNQRAFLWDSITGRQDFGTLGGWHSEAHAINNAGDFVGISRTIINDKRAVLWRNEGIIDLNAFLPEDSGWELTEAININNNGYVLGHGYINYELHIFLLRTSNCAPCCVKAIVGDVDRNCKVDFTDFAIMASRWLECNLKPPEACWE